MVLKINSHIKRVRHDRGVAIITALPASSSSLSMACAMVKDETAGGAAIIARRAMKAGPLKPRAAAAERPIAGYTSSLTTMVIIRFLFPLVTPTGLKDAPRIIMAITEQVSDIDEITPFTVAGIFIPRRRQTMAAMAPRIMGFFKIRTTRLLTVVFPPL